MEESRYQTFASCSRFDDELEVYLDGEARPFVVSHARNCSTCGSLLADLQEIRRVARELPLEEPSSVVWASVRARLASLGAFRAPACDQFEQELPAYLEGDAVPLILSHSQDCPSCRGLLADLQTIQQAARELPQEDPSPEIWARLSAKLRADGACQVPAACSQFEAELQAYLDGEARPFVVAHTEDCGACGALLADLQEIRDVARSLPLAEPSRAVWANVRARLEAEGAFEAPVSGWRQILAWRQFPHAVPLGVLAALVFIGSLLTMPPPSLMHTGNLPGVEEASAVAPLISDLSVGEDRALAHVVSDLESNFRANEASMTPDLKATYEKSLVSLDGSIRECLDSLRHEPSNTLAHDYLLAAYTSKAEVLSSALESEGR